MNVVMNSEHCPLEWKRSRLVPSRKIVMWNKYVIQRDCVVVVG